MGEARPVGTRKIDQIGIGSGHYAAFVTDHRIKQRLDAILCGSKRPDRAVIGIECFPASAGIDKMTGALVADCKQRAAAGAKKRPRGSEASVHKRDFRTHNGSTDRATGHINDLHEAPAPLTGCFARQSRVAMSDFAKCWVLCRRFAALLRAIK